MPTAGAPRRRRPWLQALGRAALRLLRWRVINDVPPESKFVAVIAPHTSNWDFVVLAAAMFVLDLDAKWFGKHTLFRWPLGPLLRALGGQPVRRDTSGGVVAAAVETFRSEPHFILALTPEGTRRRVTQWRTGFYHIAVAAGVPMVPVRLDWSRREISIGTAVLPDRALPDVIAALQANYRPEMARYPARFWVGQ